MSSRPADIDAILAATWGYSSFRPLQREIITGVLAGKDTLALLPTGGGKSITFQVPALALGGITVVVTPLISLMKDQVDNLRARDVCAVYLHSGLTRAEAKLAMDRCIVGRARLLYVSPEKIRSVNFRDFLRNLDVRLIAVDEAHCISQWGYDFRPSYLEIAKLRELFPDVPVLALTASATPAVRADIIDRLGLRNPNVFVGSFARPNISYIVRQGDFKEQTLLRALAGVPGTAIVYVRSRKRTREIAEVISRAGISADFYHAGLAPEDKNEKQRKWKDGETRVIVATNAFGMGIDKPDVRLVVHWDLPPSLEEYYQEAGRAGRDGLQSYALMLAGRNDKSLLSRRLTDAFPPRDYIRRVYELACNFADIAVGEGFNTVRDFDFALFCDRFGLQPAPARSALLLLSRSGWLEFVEDVATRSRVMVLLRKEELYSLRLDGDADAVLQTLLRAYTGLFADYVAISESFVSTHTGLGAERVYQALLTLGRAHAIHYIPRSNTPYLYLPTARELPKYVTIPTTVYEDQRARMAERLDAVRDYAFSSAGCRVNRMLAYFGERPASPCGSCDVCRESRPKKSPARPDDLAGMILYLAGQPGGHTVEYMARTAGVGAERILEALRPLLDSGAVALGPAMTVVRT